MDSAVESNTLLLPHFNNNNHHHHNSSPAWAAFTQPRRSLDDLATHGPASTATLFIRPFWLDRPDSFIFHFCCVRLSFTAHHRSIPLLRYYLITFLHSYLFCSSLLRLINYLGGFFFCSKRSFFWNCIIRQALPRAASHTTHRKGSCCVGRVTMGNESGHFFDTIIMMNTPVGKHRYLFFKDGLFLLASFLRSKWDQGPLITQC